MTDFERVGEFLAKFGLPVHVGDGPPQLIDAEAFMFRYQLLLEELGELLLAYRAGDLAGVADALVDLSYVTLGTAHMFGLPFDAVFAEVHRANMQKERASGDGDGRSKRGSSLDVVKPRGWTPPDVAAAIGLSPSQPATAVVPLVAELRSQGRFVSDNYNRTCRRCGFNLIHDRNVDGFCSDCAAQGDSDAPQSK